MKLASQEGLVPGKALGEKLDNLAAYGYQSYMALECGVPGPAEVELPKSAQYMKAWI